MWAVVVLCGIQNCIWGWQSAPTPLFGISLGVSCGGYSLVWPAQPGCGTSVTMSYANGVEEHYQSPPQLGKLVLDLCCSLSTY